jgi:NADPH:quinone reductase-like Zn-dependent oxidoreductase
MRAVVLDGPARDRLELADVPAPSPGPDELLVRTRAIGVGIHDSSFLPPGFTTPYPIGIEAAGVVEQVGGRLNDRHAPGDRIAYISANQLKGGTWAEYAVVAGDSLILDVPQAMSFEQAAAVPVAANTALRALHALPPLPAGGSLFVAGASGAVGTFAVQLAHARGWRVAASASPGNHGYLAELGAALAVDYRDPDWPDRVRRWMPQGVDAALAVQPDTSMTSATVVKDRGTVVSVSGDQGVPPRGITLTGLAYHVDVQAELVHLVDRIVAGELRLEIEHVYPFDQALAALGKVQSRRARGKVVLTLP